jgi:hypothetical protein
MNKLYLLGFIFGVVTLSNILSVTNADEYYDDTFGDDDDFQNNNAMINVRLYKNYSECVRTKNSLYYYHKNFNINCDCFKINSCFNKLKDSKKLEDYSFNYNNYSYNLNELNFTKQCYNYRGLYIYNELNIFLYCGSRIFVFSFIMIIIGACILVNFNYLMTIKKKYKYKLNNNTSPPEYQTLN